MGYGIRRRLRTPFHARRVHVVADKVAFAHVDVEGTVLRALAAHDRGSRMMAGLWRDGGTLRVVRREPYATSGGKILALHVTKGASL